VASPGRTLFNSFKSFLVTASNNSGKSDAMLADPSARTQADDVSARQPDCVASGRTQTTYISKSGLHLKSIASGVARILA
jgi:hypothetical protein